MGTKFRELWKGPQFIDPCTKEKVDNKVDLIGKIIEKRESNIDSQRDIGIDSMGSPESNTK